MCVFAVHWMVYVGASAGVTMTTAWCEVLVPIRCITHGEGHFWFGYYDKLQFDPTGRFVLGMKVDFEHRSPTRNDVVEVGLVDLDDGARWTRLGESCAWNWQQGCMLQWLPGSAHHVVWNDREADRFVCRILDIETGELRTVDAPVYSISPDGTSAVLPDFRRLNDCRPGYGYAGVPDPNATKTAPDDAGIWKVNLRTGRTELILSLAEVAAIPHAAGYSEGAKHWFNHLLWNPSGTRFVFLHRWRGAGDGRGFSTRMVTAQPSGDAVHVMDPHGQTSHFIWRDPDHVLAWAWHPSHGECFYLFRDLTDLVAAVGQEAMPVNGHCSYLPGGRYILNDTYPDSVGMQHLYVYDTATDTRTDLGAFRAPDRYRGEWRCDLHPRCSRDGRRVCVDSAHEGGRRMYLLDIAEALQLRA